MKSCVSKQEKFEMRKTTKAWRQNCAFLSVARWQRREHRERKLCQFSSQCKEGACLWCDEDFYGHSGHCFKQATEVKNKIPKITKSNKQKPFSQKTCNAYAYFNSKINQCHSSECKTQSLKNKSKPMLMFFPLFYFCLHLLKMNNWILCRLQWWRYCKKKAENKWMLK